MPLINLLLIPIVILACLAFVSAAQADTLDWAARPTTDLIANTDSATVGSITIDTHTVSTGTFDVTPTSTIEPTLTSNNSNPGIIRLGMDASADNGSAYQTTTFTFSAPVYNLSITIRDIDGGTGCACWNDLVDFNSDAGLPTSWATASGVAYNSATGRASASQDTTINNETGNVTVTWAGPVTSVTVKHIAGPRQGNPTNPDFQAVYIDDLTFVTAASSASLKLRKISNGGTGTFSFTSTNLGSTPANITTTTAGTASPPTPTPIPVTTLGSAITITETPATGYAAIAASCTDANSAVTGNTGTFGSLSGNVLTIPAANVVAGADFTCTLTNTRATVSIQKITLGSTGGAFSFADNNVAGTFTNITTTAVNTAQPAPVTARNVTTIGNQVVLTETLATNFVSNGVTCTDANSAVTGNGPVTSTTNSITIPAANIVAGSAYNCIFTNSRIPTVKFQKRSIGGTATFSFNTPVNIASAPANINTGTSNPGPATPTAINVTTIGSQVQLTEAAVAGYAMTGFSCTDANSSVTGNTGAFGSFNAATRVVTIPATNIVAGADLTCLITNTRATVKVQKTTAGGFGGPFSFAQTNLASAPANITTTAIGTPVPASPTAINVTTVGTAVTVTETPATGYVLTSASCTDANSAVTGNTGAIGTLAGNVLTIPAANVVAGADFTCVFTNSLRPTVKVQKTTTGGFGGPFSFAQTNLASAPANITTTAAGTPTPASPTAINVTTIGTAVTLTETPAAGFGPVSASCTDANSAVTGNTGAIGSLSGNVLTIPAANVKAGSDFTCVFTNSRATVKVQKTTAGGFGGPFSFAQTNLASAPGNITTSAIGTPTPASPAAINITALSAAVTVTETPATGYVLSSASCTDANSAVTGNTGSIGTLAGNVLTVPAANVKAGADFTCIFTNSLRPTVKVQKTTTGGFGGPFSFAQTNLASAPANITTAAADTPTPLAPSAINVTAIGTAVTLTETPASGYALTAASCTDANSAVTGNTGLIGTLAGNVLTIPAANVVAGADFTCVFTNTRAKVRVQKQTMGGFGGPFSFAQTNLASAPANITTTAVGTPTPASPTAINVTTIGTAVTVTETPATGYVLSSASCTDANSAVTGNTGTIGTLAGNMLTIPAANVKAGSDFTCLFTNVKTPTVKVQKTTTGGFGGPFSFAQTNLASAPGSITTTAAGTPTPASPTAINVSTAGTAVTLTETPASGYALTAASCTDANSAITGNNGAIGSLSGNVLTIPAANVNAGADYTCVFTNTKRPTITITKVSNGGTGSFSFTGTNGFANQSINTAPSGTGIGASQTLTAASTATSITETAPPGSFVLAAISCSGLGAGGTATPNLATATINLDAAATAPGANIACTFTNGIPGLTVTKTGTLNDGGDGVANAGDTISYSFTITNTGTVTLTNVSASDPGAAISGGPIAALAPSAVDSTTITGVHTLTQAEIDSGSFANTVTITANPPTGPPSTAQDTETMTLPSVPTFTVVKAQSAGPNPITALPATLTYTITVDNTGNRTLTAPAISDSLVQGTNSLTLTSGPTLTSGDTNSDNKLQPTETWIYTAAYAVTQANLDHGGNIVNTATFDSAETAPVTSAPVTTPITQTPGLTMVKTASTAGPAGVNDVITYTYIVTNTGNVTINGVTVNDVHNGYGTPPSPGGEAMSNDQAPLGDSTDAAANSNWDVLAPGDSVTFTSTYTVTQTDVDLLQ